ncbi:MAG: DMT family transporter [Flavobacteriia bacterium]|nr:DMT family transporter [Flavobacteriia bacterium]
MSKKTTATILLIVLGAVWGSSFFFMKLGMMPRPGVTAFSHIQVAGMRMLIAALILLPFSMPKFRLLFGPLGPYFLIVGLCGNFVPSFLFTYANTALSGGISGILNSMTPIFTVLIAVLLFKTKIHVLQILGILISTVGVIFLLSSGAEVSSNVQWSHIAAVIFATLLYGISVNTIKNKLSEVSPMLVTSLGLLSVLPLAAGSFFLERSADVFLKNPYGWEAFLYVLILGGVGSALSNIYFNRLIKLTSAIFASSVTYLIPFFAVIFGSIRGESLSLGQFASMIILLIGVFLVNFHDRLLGMSRNKTN